MGFINDLNQGKAMEELVHKYLTTHTQLFTKLMKTTRSVGKFSDYDYLYSFSIEVKNDKYKSDNFCFEYYNPVSDKFSGIWASKADFIVYVTDSKIIFFDREELMMELLFAQKLDRKLTGYKHRERVGDGNANIILFKKSYILDNFKSIKHRVDLDLT